MECPTCATTLERAKYENVTVFQCAQCSGYLIHKRRMVVIKSSRDQSRAALQEEAEAERRPDSEETIRCPRCLVPRMRKQPIKISAEVEFHLDTCQECDHVWFDGGELARWQINYEQGAQGQEEEQMRRRAQMRTPEQKAATAEIMAALPRSRNFLAGASRELFFWIGCGASFLASIVCVEIFNQPLLGSAASLLAAALLAVGLVYRMETRNLRWSAVAGVTIAEILYLYFYLLAG
jgi:Zn-finger nucleic acid-binding protein